MEWISRAVDIICLLLVTQIAGVMAYNSDIVGIAVSGCISFFLLSIVIGILVVSFQWHEWFNHWMRRKGKVRMPKAYFKKKEELKRKLVAESSRANSEVNGHLPAQTVDRGGQKASWVQGWNQRTTNFDNKIYEEKDVTMVLGDEADEEFKIETVLVDNEVLDVGPFRNDHSKEMPIEGDVYPEPYIYSTVDTSRKGKSSTATTSGEPTTAFTTTEMVEQKDPPAKIGDYQDVEFKQALIHL